VRLPGAITSRLSRCNANKRLKYVDSEVTTDMSAAMQDSPSGQVLKYVTEGDLVLLQDKTCLNDNIINGAQLLVRGNSTDSGLRNTVLVSAHCTQLVGWLVDIFCLDHSWTPVPNTV